MDVQLNDILIMKKKHPCGENQFKVLRIGMDFKIQCVKCTREIMAPRNKIEKNIKSILRDKLL